MDDVMISIVIGVLKGMTLIYDALSYIPWYVLNSPRQKRKQSNRIKAKPTREGDPSSPYRTIDCFDHLTTTPFDGCETVDDLFQRAASLHASNLCLGTREVLSEEDEVQPSGKVFKKCILGEYHWETFEEINSRLRNFGSGLLALGQKPRQNILIFAETRAQWMIATQACLKFNFPVVTLYATLGDDAVIHGIKETEVNFVITSFDLLPKFKRILSQTPKVNNIIYMDQPNKRPQLDDFPKSVQIHSMSSVEELGARPENAQVQITKPTREDIAVIMYTSGSTGIPKGVLITHGNLMCGMSGQCQRVPRLGPDDVYIGYLPLAHVLELTAELSCLSYGVPIGYSSPQTLSDQSAKIKKGSQGDATVLRPTLMTAVPVIMDRLYKAVWDKVNSGGKLSLALFTFAYDYKTRKLGRGYDTPLFNRTVFKKIRGLLGGRVRLMMSGGAPLSEDTQKFMNVCFCCPVGQGYGLTETCGAGTIHDASDLSLGRVGAPLQCNEIMLKDWEEGGYRTSDTPLPRGEILIGGGNVTQGYYKNPEKTKEDFVEFNNQRWFCTGDIGEWQDDGCLKIIDRKKDLVKLQTGEYVSLAKVETALKLAPLIDNCCVCADSSKLYTVCLVVPNHKHLKAVAEKLDLDSDNFAELCKNKAVEAEMLKAVQEQAKKTKLDKFEVPTKLTLCQEIWTPEMGLLTEAFKLRRKFVEKFYKNDISRMYA